MPPRQTSRLTPLGARRRAEKPGRSPLAREPPGTPGTDAQAPVQRVGLLPALPRPTGLGPPVRGKTPRVPISAGPGWAGPGGPPRAVRGGLGRGGESAEKGAAVAGGGPAPCGRRRGPAFRVFCSARRLRQKLRRPLGTRLPGPSCPFSDTQKSARGPDNAPARLLRGPSPLRPPSHLPGGSGTAAGGKQPRPPQLCFCPCPLPLRRLSPPPRPLYYFSFPPRVAGWGGGAGAESSARRGKKGSQPTPRRRQPGPQRRAPAGLPAARLLHPRRLPRRGPRLPPGPAAAPRLPGPRGQRADPGQNNGGQREGEGRGDGGAAGGRYGGGSPPALPPFFRRSATPGARRSAEEITVRSITCQTSNWIGYFLPPLLLTPSILQTPKVPLGLCGLSHSARAVSHALNSPVMRCMDLGLREM